MTKTRPFARKAWSQNLGHEQVVTTFTSFGQISPHRQGELIQNSGLNHDESNRPVTTKGL